jgi:thiamine biosynthesis protein ThiS
MRVTINGGEEDIETDVTVAALVARFNLEPKHVAVEINQDLVSRGNYDSTTLKEGDRIEIVTLVGGG